MNLSLFLLILMGHCSSFTCHLYKYHFIKDGKTWDEAQKSCKEKYIDLATVFTMTDMERLLKSTQSQESAWIGLYSPPGNENRKWHWSQPQVEFNENQTRWESGEPNDYKRNPENCALMTNNKWKDFPCTSSHNFMCYSESKHSNTKFNKINVKMTWPQAQSYCRVNHTDLISGLKQLDDVKSQLNVGNQLWIGLFRDTWRWSDGSSSSFRYWDNVSPNDLVKKQSDKKCATTVLNKAGKWSFDDCNNKKPFICYSGKVILIKQDKTWNEALNYCRKKYHDLVSITSPNIQAEVQEEAKKAKTTHVWIGLRYTCTLDLWFWVSDEPVCYDNWDLPKKTNECGHAAAMEPNGQNKWFKMDSTNKFNFICSTR
ncbi:Macrophage mannose receptor 1 [Channa argus]|uniref:Macrophage mannose receptor 1 n=1 Tax=Channa argus TaxID=215402 RepID=A0A6G1Q5E9_CHAAH|nr:Macrophage mannose receptor 1 [Channa argus]